MAAGSTKSCSEAD